MAAFWDGHSKLLELQWNPCGRGALEQGKLLISQLGINSMASWSLSFFPLPISMWRRKSTSGVSIDFNFINLLGFACYATYTATFLFSPVVRDQYAARHPAAPEPTVRFNDLAFAGLGVVMCLIAYSMFWPGLSGLHTPRRQRVSWTMRGLFSGCVLAPLVVICIVLARSPDGGNDPFSWAWIDVVSVT
jgi:cystinosin